MNVLYTRLQCESCLSLLDAKHMYQPELLASVALLVAAAIPASLKAQGYSNARAFSATQLTQNPNAFFYRNVAPDQQQVYPFCFMAVPLSCTACAASFCLDITVANAHCMQTHTQNWRVHPPKHRARTDYCKCRLAADA